MHRSTSADHAGHDVLLIAGHAAGDLSNLDLPAAAALLESCDACAELHRDLVAIAAATRALPRTAHVPRDFRLTEDHAERLARRSWLRSVVRPFASARSATRPLAAALTSAGVAGLVVAAFIPALLGGAASAPGGSAGAFAPAPTSAPAAAPANPQAAEPGAAAASADRDFVKQAEDSGVDVAVGEGITTDTGGKSLTSEEDGGRQRLAAAPSPNLLVVGSLALLVLGLSIFGLRFAARRLR